MSDIEITIGTESRKFDLARDENSRKIWSTTQSSFSTVVSPSSPPSYGSLPPERLLAIGMDNWQGGLGQYSQAATKFMVDKYFWGESIDDATRNCLMLGPKRITTPTINDAIVKFCMFKSREYAMSLTKVYRMSVDELTWDFVLDLSAVPADSLNCIGVYDGYIFVGSLNNKYWYSASGDYGSWTQSTLDNAYAALVGVIPPTEGSKDTMAIVKYNNEMRTSITPLNGSVGWSDVYYIGDNSHEITNIIVLNGIVLVCKADGVYYMDADAMPVMLMSEMRTKAWPGFINGNFAAAVIWQACLYSNLREKIMELDSSYNIDFVGPWDLYPVAMPPGVIGSMASNLEFIYVAAVWTDGVTSPAILRGRQRTDEKYGLRWEWSPYIAAVSTPQVISIMQRFAGNAKLHMGGVANQVSYVQLSNTTSYPPYDIYSNYKFSNTGHIITSYYDCGYASWQKVFYQLRVNISAKGTMSDTCNIKFYYQTDTNTNTWTHLATFIDTGLHSIDIPPISCNRIRLKIEFNSMTDTSTPILNEFVLAGYLQPEDSRVFDFTMTLEQGMFRKSSSDLAFLQSGRQAHSPIKLADMRFKQTYYVQFLPDSPEEGELMDTSGKEVSKVARVRAQKLNWTPPS